MSEDPRIQAFERANRRRGAIAGMVAGVLIVIGAAIVLVYMLGWSHDELDKGRRGGGGYQVIVLLGGAVLVGLLLIGNAIRGLQNKPPLMEVGAREES